MTRRPWFPPLVFLALAVAWTWPAAVSGDWVGRYGDTPGTIWTLSAAPRLVWGGLHDDLTAWPTGIDYLRPDSWILLVFGTLFAWMDTARLHSLLQVVGLAGSAWSAEVVAVRLGAPRPASLLAGIGYMFGGLASTVLLEGHVYQIVNPWLPLLVLGWCRATGPEGRARDGVVTAVGFIGALLTTAYTGVAAVVLLTGILLGSLFERERGLRAVPLVSAAAVAVPVGLAYAWLFARGDGAWASRNDFAVGASATLLSLLGPSDVIDGVYHSQVAAIPATILALFVAAPVVLRRQVGWRTMGVAAGVALLASLGAWLQTDPAHRLFPLPLAALDLLPGSDFLHFPLRLGWGWGLCAGIVAARVAGRIAEDNPRAPLVLCLLLVVDLFVYIGMPWRQRTQPSAAPSAYAQSDGPVLEVFPVDVHPTHALDLRVMTLSCAWQATHHRPIADACITTSPSASPRAVLDREVWRRALSGEPVAPLLGDLGFTTAVLHADLFRPADRALLEHALEEMDPDPYRSTDGGAALTAYRVPEVPGAEPRAAWERAGLR